MAQNNWKNNYHLSDVLYTPSKLDLKTYKRILKMVHNVIIQHPSIIEKCPEVVEEWNTPKNSRYYIKAPMFRNNSLIANHFGPFTVDEIATMMEETRDTIYSIEKSAKKKLRKALFKIKKENLL